MRQLFADSGEDDRTFARGHGGDSLLSRLAVPNQERFPHHVTISVAIFIATVNPAPPQLTLA